MHVQIFCFSSSYLSLLHEKIYCHSLFIYMEKWVSIKWVPMCLNTIILGMPLPEGVSAIAGNLIFFYCDTWWVWDGYHSQKNLNFYTLWISFGTCWVLQLKSFLKKIKGWQAFCKKWNAHPQKLEINFLVLGEEVLYSVMYPPNTRGNSCPVFYNITTIVMGLKNNWQNLTKNK